MILKWKLWNINILYRSSYSLLLLLFTLQEPYNGDFKPLMIGLNSRRDIRISRPKDVNGSSEK